MAARKNKTQTKKPKQINEFARALIFSATLHGLFLLLLAGHIPGCGGAPTGGETKQEQEKHSSKKHGGEGDIMPKPVEIELVEVPKQKTDDTPSYQKATHASEKCENYFGGIGIQYSSRLNGSAGLITSVPEGYPAAKAGIQAGERIVNFDEIRGKVGTMVEVQIQNSSGTRTVKMVRDKICVQKAIDEWVQPDPEEP